VARRKGGLTELLDFVSTLPWQAAASLAPISFLTLHLLSAVFAQTTPVTNTADLGSVVIRQGIHSVASLLQYIIPPAFLFGAIISFIKCSRSLSLYESVRGNPTVNVATLTWQEFEILVGEGFRYRGFHVIERGGAAPDGGVDLVLTRGGERFLVQCKQWRARQVGVTIIRELYGVMAAEGAAGGYVVTSGRFTKYAQQFASGRNIELVDGEELDGFLCTRSEPVPVYKTAKTEASPKTSLVEVRPNPRLMEGPTCPKCKLPMVVRVAARGVNAGKQFWGCAQFPACRKTLRMG